MKSKNLAAAAGLLVTSLSVSSGRCMSSLNFPSVSAKYRQIGCLLSAGDNVINQDGDPTYDINDHISFHIYFLDVAEFLTCPLTTSKSLISL
jgi:hypothetical protein